MFTELVYGTMSQIIVGILQTFVKKPQKVDNWVKNLLKDGRLFTELVYGTISRKLLLEYYLTPFVKKPQKSIIG